MSNMSKLDTNIRAIEGVLRNHKILSDFLDLCRAGGIDY